ncbi:ferredoxin [Desulfolutivibrio sulfoxidireducens]|uniref:ferredoxin n=1 Tax=Desulfolutivibrio sulfoxidireducens TaxID=2773299 RepID=UPI00159E5DB1|nr:ferredoxin [Desulfolutivibrio sulfoxidireducens]QLA17472.1 ferredoxin [Desulfolutivibrio sulfoxidireducens]QLA21057.1 ferredoxin [Desulfolutivibrio sulfoxidireducens]
MPKIFIDTGECIGCQACMDICPRVFRMGEDGVCELIDEDLADLLCVQEAIDTCPVECLHWE